MQFKQTLVLNPRFDYLQFYEEGLFTDCEVQVWEHPDSPDKRTIRAHRAVLANGGEFFKHLVTGDMQEARTGVMEAKYFPFAPFESAVKFLYSGTIVFSDDAVMQIFHIARHYQIRSLLDLLVRYMKDAPPDVFLRFVDDCWSYELIDELILLEPVILHLYKNLTIERLSAALDVGTFCHVLKGLNKPMAEKFADLSKFLGNWECTKKDMADIGDVFRTAPVEVQRLFGRFRGKWLPAGFRFSVQ
jgi:hypothetical protein